MSRPKSLATLDERQVKSFKLMFAASQYSDAVIAKRFNMSAPTMLKVAKELGLDLEKRKKQLNGRFS